MICISLFQQFARGDGRSVLEAMVGGCEDVTKRQDEEKAPKDRLQKAVYYSAPGNPDDQTNLV
jgi:hypothetical protein